MSLFLDLTNEAQNVLIDHAIEELEHNGLPDETLTFRYDSLYDFHHKLFNEDYWFYSHYEAYKWMSSAFQSMDFFQLIDYVRDYEESMFGEFRTLVQKDEIGNMLVYIAGEEMLHEECSITDDTLIKDVIKQLKKLRHDDD
tara:strand:- start:1234 stop:1656 length:423 start_codon:yes stop_codon:yes gene_type:complete